MKGPSSGHPWNTLTTVHSSAFFLSDEAHSTDPRDSYADDPIKVGEEIGEDRPMANMTTPSEVYNIEGGDFEGKLMVVQ